MAQRFIKTIDKYIGTLTDETDPDIVIARLDITIIEEKRLFFFFTNLNKTGTGAQKLHAFLERHHTLLNAAVSHKKRSNKHKRDDDH